MVLYVCNLPIHDVDLAKEYQLSLRFRDIHLYIVKNELPSLVPAKRRVKADTLNYVVISKTIFHTNIQEKLINLT